MILSIKSSASDSASSHYTETDAKLFSKFSKMASCASKPLKEKCQKCLNPGSGYKFYFFYQTTRINKFNYKFMIHYNDVLKKILVTFSGPSVKEHIYIKYIYSAGFSLVKKYNFQVEKEYYLVYFTKIRKILKQKLEKLKSSGRKKFQTYFSGHSIGGSLATLAAFDMQQSKVMQNIKVFSLAPLRLGDASFVAMVNSYVTVYRIVKKNDYLVRIPNCYYSSTYKIWRCFNQSIVKQFILKPTFPLKIYVNSYLTYYKRTNTILKAAIVFARKRISQGKVHLKRTPSNKKVKRKLKIAKEVKKANLLKKLLKKTQKKAKQVKRKTSSVQKILKKLNQKVNKSEKSLKKFNPKKVKKSSKIVTKQLKLLSKKKIVDKNSKMKLRKMIENSKKISPRKLKKKPTALKQRIRKFFRRVRSIARRVSRKARNLLNNVQKQKRKIMKKKPHRRQNKQTKHKKQIKHKKQTKQKKIKKLPKKTKIKSKAKKPTKSKKTLPVLKTKPTKAVAKTYTFIPTTFKVYSPLETYFNFVYYTQPIGYQIFYNDSMTDYTTCMYINGISLCEKVVALPLQFSVEVHMSYFGVYFYNC
jgi:hypothetical protein